MDRRDFIKKATMAAAGAAVVSPVSAMLDSMSGKQCKVLLINGSPRTDGNTFCCLQEIEATLQKATLQTMNMMFEMMNMPVVTSQYWNIAYGAGKGEVKLDTEGMQTMRTLATNMAFLLQKIHADGDSAPKRDERPQFMNFIR